jgi:hypothetical protein
MKKQLHIAVITDSGICDIFTALTERGLLNKLENYLCNEKKFNTKQEFEDYLYDNEDPYERCEVFFEVQELDLSED